MELHRKCSWFLAKAKFSFQVGVEIAVRLIGERRFISWKMAKNLFSYLGTFPQFHIPFFSEMLVPVKFKYTCNFLCQGLVPLTINLSEYQFADPSHHTATEKQNQCKNSCRNETTPFGNSCFSVEWSQTYNQSKPRILFHPVCQWQNDRLMQPVAITSVQHCMNPWCYLVLL